MGTEDTIGELTKRRSMLRQTDPGPGHDHPPADNDSHDSHDTAATGYRALAPDAEPDWVEAFVLEQRLLGVPGDGIGDALAVVQSHLVDSGESARDAFGDPVAYARDAATGRRVDDDRDPSWLLGSGLGLAGMIITVFAARSWVDGDARLALTVGHLVVLGLVAATFALLHLRPEPFLRFVLYRTWLALVLFVVHFTVMVGALVLLTVPVLHLPARVALGVGVVFLTLGTVLEWRSRTAGHLHDPILAPGQSRPSRRGLGWLERLTVLLFPLLTIAMLGLSLLLAALA